MEITVRQLAGVRFEVEARTHHLICDQPLDQGGTDSGMTPPELLLASLGTCAAYYAQQYLRARSLPEGGLTVRVDAVKAAGPARLDGFHIAANVPGLVDPRHIAGLRTSVERCLIHNTLLRPPSIQVRVSGAAGESVSSGVNTAGGEVAPLPLAS